MFWATGWGSRCSLCRAGEQWESRSIAFFEGEEGYNSVYFFPTIRQKTSSRLKESRKTLSYYFTFIFKNQTKTQNPKHIFLSHRISEELTAKTTLDPTDMQQTREIYRKLRCSIKQMRTDEDKHGLWRQVSQVNSKRDRGRHLASCWCSALGLWWQMAAQSILHAMMDFRFWVKMPRQHKEARLSQNSLSII